LIVPARKVQEEYHLDDKLQDRKYSYCRMKHGMRNKSVITVEVDERQSEYCQGK
jgi:hypothetical protein